MRQKSYILMKETRTSSASEVVIKLVNYALTKAELKPTKKEITFPRKLKKR